MRYSELLQQQYNTWYQTKNWQKSYERTILRERINHICLLLNFAGLIISKKEPTSKVNEINKLIQRLETELATLNASPTSALRNIDNEQDLQVCFNTCENGGYPVNHELKEALKALFVIQRPNPIEIQSTKNQNDKMTCLHYRQMSTLQFYISASNNTELNQLYENLIISKNPENRKHYLTQMLDFFKFKNVPDNSNLNLLFNFLLSALTDESGEINFNICQRKMEAFVSTCTPDKRIQCECYWASKEPSCTIL
jgi:hypothetical protein